MLRFLHPTEWTLLLILASACFLLLPGFYSNDTTIWLETSGPFFGIGQPWGIYATTKILAAVWPSHGSLVLFNQLVIFSGLALLFRGLKFSKFVGLATAAAVVLVNSSRGVISQASGCFSVLRDSWPSSGSRSLQDRSECCS